MTASSSGVLKIAKDWLFAELVVLLLLGKCRSSVASCIGYLQI
jgi:hypothetical protein